MGMIRHIFPAFLREILILEQETSTKRTFLNFLKIFWTFHNLLHNRRKQCFGFCYCCKPVCVEFACANLPFLIFASHKNPFKNITEMHFNLMQTNKSVISCVFCRYFDDVFTMTIISSFRPGEGEMDCCCFCGTR